MRSPLTTPLAGVCAGRYLSGECHQDAVVEIRETDGRVDGGQGRVADARRRCCVGQCLVRCGRLRCWSAAVPVPCVQTRQVVAQRLSPAPARSTLRPRSERPGARVPRAHLVESRTT